MRSPEYQRNYARLRRDAVAELIDRHPHEFAEIWNAIRIKQGIEPLETRQR